MQHSSTIEYRGRGVRVDSRSGVRQLLYLLTLQPGINERESQRQATVAVWMNEEARSGRRTVYRTSR